MLRARVMKRSRVTQSEMMDGMWRIAHNSTAGAGCCRVRSVAHPTKSLARTQNQLHNHTPATTGSALKTANTHRTACSHHPQHATRHCEGRCWLAGLGIS